MQILEKEGDSASIGLHSVIHATLGWKAAVDLDLHCKALMKDGRKVHILFSNMGSKTRFPYICLDKDSGVGDVGGNNEENIHFMKPEEIQHLIIVANIYGKSLSKFSKYDGSVTVKSGDQEIKVPLTSTKRGSWCVVAHLDNSGDKRKLINVNKTQLFEPEISSYS